MGLGLMHGREECGQAKADAFAGLILVSSANEPTFSRTNLPTTPTLKDAGYEVRIFDCDLSTSEQHFQFVYFEKRNNTSRVIATLLAIVSPLPSKRGVNGDS